MAASLPARSPRARIARQLSQTFNTAATAHRHSAAMTSSTSTRISASTAPPGPAGPWFGLPHLRALRRDYLGFLERLQRDHGDFVHVRMGPERTYDIFHPDWIRELLVERAAGLIRWERGIDVFAQAHGRSVIVTEGDTWQRQRRMLQPAFGPRRMAEHAARMTAAAGHALDTWQIERTGRVDFERAMTQLTMDVILRTLFSAESPRDAVDAERAVRLISLIGMEEMFWPVTLPDWLPLPGKRDKRWALRTLDTLVRRHIRERRASPGDPQGPTDLLGMLLGLRDEEGNGQGLSDDEVRDQCMTIFLAGHETTAAALTWWGWLMATHPECAEQAAAEVDHVLGQRVPGHDDVARLPWLGQTLKETLRLYPAAPALLSRRITAPLNVGPWTLPRGALVRLTPWVVHRDPRWHADPLRFDPNRFAPGSPASTQRGTYLPFGAGPRVCLGSLFAMTEMTLVAAMLLQRFRLALPEGEPPVRAVLNVTLRPADGLHLVLHRRA